MSTPTPAHQAQRAHQAWQDGCKHRSAGRHVPARAAFARAVKTCPDEALYWINLARSERQLGATQACEDAAQRAALLSPGQWAYCYFLVERLQKVRNYTAALDALDRYASATPGRELPAAWQMARGEAMYHLNRTNEAIPPFMQALVLSSTGPQGDTELARIRRNAALMLGHSLAALKRRDEAAVCYRMSLDTDPMAIGSALYAAHYSAWGCDWAELPTDLQRLQETLNTVRALPAGASMQDFSPFCLLGLSDDPDLMRWCAEHAGPNADAPLPAAVRAPRRIPRPDGRLRLGLISSDFHHHATSMLLVQALEHIDRSRYELFFYSGGPDDRSPLRSRILATATQVHEVALWSHARLTEQIRQDQIGVLFDLKGFTADHRLEVIAARPAPLQVAWLGYPGTSGSAHLDYVMGDAVVTPLENQADFTETIAQLPHCYQPNDGLRSQPAPWSRAECGLPEEALVLASFNQAYKTTPEVFAAWCRILAATPHAVLWMLVPEADTQARLREAAQRHGIDGQRLIFAPFLGIESHRSRLPQADLILDTFPCSGHTTASDALWAGVPVLTLIGRTFAARVAASLLHTLDLDELICADLDTYTARALALCHDTAALADVRARLAQAIQTSPLFDGARFAADWQALIERMVARQDAGLAPAPLAAQVG